ncbi:hypothetical protein ACSQ67_008902 [Phaseolus vulgaris]
MKLCKNSRHLTFIHNYLCLKPPFICSCQNHQDPAEADKLLKIQRELDETKIILHKTIDSVLARGEKLDSLVEKSSDLSAASQVHLNNSFYTTLHLGLVQQCYIQSGIHFFFYLVYVFMVIIEHACMMNVLCSFVINLFNCFKTFTYAFSLGDLTKCINMDHV